MKKYISILLVVTLLLALFSAMKVIAVEGDETSNAEGDNILNSTNIAIYEQYKEKVKEKVADNNSLYAGLQCIGENDEMEFYAVTDSKDEKFGEIALLEKSTGYVWRSNPLDAADDEIAKANGHSYYSSKSQIILSYSRAYNSFEIYSYNASNMNGLLTCEVLTGGRVKYIYRFPELKFVIPVMYTIDEKGFKAELLLNDEEAVLNYTVIGKYRGGQEAISVEQEIDMNVTKIQLLPLFGATSFNEEGYMFIPDGSGALVYYNNGKTNVSQPYKAPVYGKYKESKIEEFNKEASNRFYLPVFGTVKNDGHALMGIIEDNASVGYINCETSGYRTAYNKVYSSYLHKIVKAADAEEGKLSQPISNELRDPEKNYSVRYYCLSGDEASYSGMAKRYRQYLIEEKGMKKSDDLRDSALFLDVYAGVEKESSIMGIPVNVFDVKTTYDDIISISDDMTNAGIDDVVFRYNDWTKMSKRKKVQNKPTFENSVGGKKGFAEAKKYLQDKNMGLYLNIDFVNYSESGNGFSRFSDAVKFPNQAPAYQTSGITAHINLGKRWCLLKADKVKKAALDFASNCEKYGINALSLESIGNTIYSDGSNKGALTRGQCVNYWEDIFDEYKNLGLKILTSKPAAYSIIDADVLLELPAKETYVEIADEGVPFYQMVVRGYKTYTTETVNMSSTPEEILLNAAETGSSLLYSLMAGDTKTLKETYLKYLYSCNYGQLKEDIISDYIEFKKVMECVDGQEIDKHEKVAEDVFKTTYSNGVSIYVNYNEEDVTLENGFKVPAKKYIAKRGE